MRNNDILGIIISSAGSTGIPELTTNRTMASVPIGGKYRIIDFALSNFSNSGINNVGIITNKNFLSLMDHVGSGKSWDLSKRRSGLTLLPPYGGNDYDNIIEMIYNIRGYIENCREQYVLLSTGNFITNFDYSDVFEAHSKNNADATIVYRQMEVPTGIGRPMIVKSNSDNKITEILLKPEAHGIQSMTLGTVLLSKDLLMSIIKNALSKNETDIKKVIQRAVKNYNVYGFKSSGYCAAISSMQSYFKFNMDLMKPKVRDEIFQSTRPIYTKVRDDTPCRYGLTSSVKNSLVSQGCVINGTVENCVLSKGVYIGEGTVVKDCIIMQDTRIGNNVNLNFVVIDKDVVIKDDRSLMGYKSYPIYISKKSTV